MLPSLPDTQRSSPAFRLLILHILILAGSLPSLLCFMVTFSTHQPSSSLSVVIRFLYNFPCPITVPSPPPSASIIWTPVVVLFLVITIWRYNTTYTATSHLALILTARCRELGLGSLPERLKGDLQSGTRVWNLELLENRGVQYADATKFDVGVETQHGLDAFLDGSETGVLPGRLHGAVVDCCRTTREICGIYNGEW